MTKDPVYTITFTKEGVVVKFPTGINHTLTLDRLHQRLAHLLWLRVHLFDQIKEARKWIEAVERLQ